MKPSDPMSNSREAEGENEGLPHNLSSQPKTNGGYLGRALFRSYGFKILGEDLIRERPPARYIGYRLPHCGPRALAAKRIDQIDFPRFRRWKEGREDEDLCAQIAEDIRALLHFWQPVVPKTWVISYPPQGVSAAKDLSYSTARIAGFLSWVTGLEVRELFERTGEKIRHGKHASLEAGGFKVIAYCQEPVLIVDDLATSGGTMLRCLDACAKAGITAWGLVWATF